uniref:Uncharacterized protein n=1 Tax=Arundo donax TaxID=35708 RepID=A0A0A9B4F7_ARUDO
MLLGMNICHIFASQKVPHRCITLSVR